MTVCCVLFALSLLQLALGQAGPTATARSVTPPSSGEISDEISVEILGCGRNEVPTSCFPCDETCCGHVACPDLCTSFPLFCRCKDGYVRLNGQCVPRSFCGVRCGPNEEPTNCPPCDPTCTGQLPLCILAPCYRDRRFCKCKPNYVRWNGRCILKRECPTTGTPSTHHPPTRRTTTHKSTTHKSTTPRTTMHPSSPSTMHPPTSMTG